MGAKRVNLRRRRTLALMRRRLGHIGDSVGVTAALFLVFTIVGTYFFVRSDRNR